MPKSVSVFWHTKYNNGWQSAINRQCQTLPSHPHWGPHFIPFTRPKSHVTHREWRPHGKPVLTVEDICTRTYIGRGHRGYLNPWKQFVGQNSAPNPNGCRVQVKTCPFSTTAPCTRYQNHLHSWRLILTALHCPSSDYQKHLPTALLFPIINGFSDRHLLCYDSNHRSLNILPSLNRATFQVFVMLPAVQP